MSPSIALKEVMFATAWVSDGSTSKYHTGHVSNTPTNSWNESLPLASNQRILHNTVWPLLWQCKRRDKELITKGKKNTFEWQRAHRLPYRSNPPYSLGNAPKLPRIFLSDGQCTAFFGSCCTTENNVEFLTTKINTVEVCYSDTLGNGQKVSL